MQAEQHMLNRMELPNGRWAKGQAGSLLLPHHPHIMLNLLAQILKRSKTKLIAQLTRECHAKLTAIKIAMEVK